MYKKHLVYGIIIAKGTSRGLLNKNIKHLAGKPMISYIINAALLSANFDKIFLFTEDKKIGQIGQGLGVEVIYHSVRFSKRNIPSFRVIQNALKVFKKQEKYPDIIVTLRPTSPLCLPKDIDKAIKLLVKNEEVDSVISVTKSDIHPYRILKINNNGRLEHLDKKSTEKKFPQQRQTFDPVYVRNGAIYATRTRIIEAGSLWGENYLPFIMPKERSVNINDLADFIWAEALMQKKIT